MLGVPIDAIDWDAALARIEAWGRGRESKVVCICNVHSVVTAGTDRGFFEVLNSADMATPDGAPIAWMLRRLGWPRQERINGPDLMWKYLALAERNGQSVFFFGSTDDTLAKLRAAVDKAFPKLIVAGMHSPPWRALTEVEQAAEVRMLRDSGAAVVFVGLGCPKQERWMAARRGEVPSVMIGVGAAFDYHAGTVARAPLWMQERGLEWLYRLLSEPRRLWRRYLVTNSIFVFRAALQLIGAASRRNG